MTHRTILNLSCLVAAGGLVLGCARPDKSAPAKGRGQENRGVAAMAGAPPAMAPARPGPRRAPARIPPARAVTAPPPGLLLGPVPADADQTAEARHLYARLVCQGRAPDGPCKSLNQAVAAYHASYLKPMRPWLAARRPKALPPALLYPFSGGDLISALSVFPDQRQFLHFSLEHGGPATAIRGMSAVLELAARWKAVWMARNLLMAGESFSVDLQKQEHAGLPGVLPLLLVALRVHGGAVTGLSYVKVAPDGTLTRYRRDELTSAGPLARRHAPGWRAPRFSQRFSNLELRFRLPGDTQDRSVIHVAANLSNAGLAKRPGLLALIKRLGPHALMIKAASYLMWGESFSAIRDAVFARAAWGITDVSAPYPMWLLKRGWHLEAYGRFECMGRKRLHKSSIGWRLLFSRPRSRTIPFRYGYVDCKSQHHVVLLSRKK